MWIEHLTALLSAVAKEEAGQVGRLKVWPPDPALTQAIELIASNGQITLIDGTAVARKFRPDQAAEAVAAYCALVEGHS